MTMSVSLDRECSLKKKGSSKLAHCRFLLDHPLGLHSSFVFRKMKENPIQWCWYLEPA